MELTNTPVKTSGWKSLESFLDDVDTKLHSFGEFADAAAGEAQLKAHLGLMEVEEMWGRTKADLFKMIGRMKDIQARPAAAIEEGKIELFFGKEDAKASLAELRIRLEATERHLEGLGKTATADAKAALIRLKDAYEAIRDKLLN